ncbi:uncharacterized protein DUF992 [Roseibium hamelinense]|uniref:Uncharacterized protein DUF992 n=1 Tax=Roseibium hamelinense TaxID=150831 RepID=A0A562T940_9HYPH|nr:DUF992 domain-containing protein [Roseibium hamelinense]MTI45581.1 DUF992 domain-containing protein [Roseibium hamelinense]TWI90042.1 uncharacterized protein DUF992 [Roseibium hamelinense]
MNLKAFLTAALIAAPFGSAAFASDTAPGVQIGVLTCAITGESGFIIGSNHTLGCNFKPRSGGPVQYYTGKVSEYGLDLGTTKDATLVWGVLAPSADMKPGALSGRYAGVSAGVSVGAGVQANALIGGLDKSIALNPFSLQSETGTNLTLGVSTLTLEHIN